MAAGPAQESSKLCDFTEVYRLVVQCNRQVKLTVATV